MVFVTILYGALAIISLFILTAENLSINNLSKAYILIGFIIMGQLNAIYHAIKNLSQKENTK